MNLMSAPIVMPEEAWRNSQYSIAAYSGSVKINGDLFVLVDKRGHDIYACLDEANRLGREYAIEPGGAMRPMPH